MPMKLQKNVTSRKHPRTYKPLQRKTIHGQKYRYAFTIRGKVARAMLENLAKDNLMMLQIPDSKKGTIQYWLNE